jgi:hypothetical protein
VGGRGREGGKRLNQAKSSLNTRPTGTPGAGGMPRTRETWCRAFAKDGRALFARLDARDQALLLSRTGLESACKLRVFDTGDSTKDSTGALVRLTRTGPSPPDPASRSSVQMVADCACGWLLHAGFSLLQAVLVGPPCRAWHRGEGASPAPRCGGGEPLTGTHPPHRADPPRSSWWTGGLGDCSTTAAT